MLNQYGENLSNFFGGYTIRKKGGGREQGIFLKQLLRAQRYEIGLDAEIDKQKTESLQKVPKSETQSKEAADIRKRFVEEVRRQQIREQNVEIREYQGKLRSSYVLKSISAQISEKEAKRKKEKEMKALTYDVLEQARINDKELDRIYVENDLQRKNKFRRELRDQLAQGEAKKAKYYQDLQKEKQILDEIAKKLHEEHLEELKEQKAKQEEFKACLRHFIQIQNDLKESQRKQMEQEDQKMGDLVALKEKEAQQLKEYKRKKLEARERIANDIGMKIKKEHDEKLKRRQILEELYIEERVARDEEKYRLEQEKEMRERAEIKKQLDKTKEDLMKRHQEELEEDLRYREEQKHLLEESVRLGQSSNENRRKKLIAYKRGIEECVSEAKRQRAQEFAIALKERDVSIQEERQKAELVEEERIRLLKEHANNLVGYFRPGVLRESDKTIFTGCQQIEHYDFTK